MLKLKPDEKHTNLGLLYNDYGCYIFMLYSSKAYWTFAIPIYSFHDVIIQETESVQCNLSSSDSLSEGDSGSSSEEGDAKTHEPDGKHTNLGKIPGI